MLFRSHESSETRKDRSMLAWSINQCYMLNLLHGDIVLYLPDDDVLYKHTFQTYVNFFTNNPEAMAAFTSQDIATLINGKFVTKGERRAMTKAGRACNGGKLNCVVDLLQFCHRRQAVRRIKTPLWPEAQETAHHCDGLFMEKIGALYPVYPIDIKTGCNRRTPLSTYAPCKSSPVPYGELIDDEHEGFTVRRNLETVRPYSREQPQQRTRIKGRVRSTVTITTHPPRKS